MLAAPGGEVREVCHAAPSSLLPALFVASTSQAMTSFTTSTGFEAGLLGTATVSRLDFEGVAAGTLLPSGSSLGGVTFTYSIDSLSMKVTNSFDTTSPTNSLGLTGGDEAFLDGDTITLSLGQPLFALGLCSLRAIPS